MHFFFVEPMLVGITLYKLPQHQTESIITKCISNAYSGQTKTKNGNQVPLHLFERIIGVIVCAGFEKQKNATPCAQVQFTNWDIRPHWRVHLRRLMLKWVPQCSLFTFSLKVLLSPNPWSSDPSPINLLDWIRIIQFETIYLYLNMDGSFLCLLLSSQAHWSSLVQIIALLEVLLHTQ